MKRLTLFAFCITGLFLMPAPRRDASPVRLFAQQLPLGSIPTVSGNGSGAFAHYIPLSTAAGQQGLTDSTGFPVVVDTDVLGISTYFKTTANGGYVYHTVSQTGGAGGTEPADAVVGTNSDCSSLLPWETELYGGAASGHWVFHFKIPVLHHAATDMVYICFGSASVAAQQNTGAYAPSAVWDSHYRSVWHLPDGSTLSAVDSTSNANNGTVNGPTATSGLMGGGSHHTWAANPYILGSNVLNTSDITLSAWVHLYGGIPGSGQVCPLIGLAQGNGSSINDKDVYFDASGTGKIVFRIYDDGGEQVTSSTGLTPGAWNYIAGVQSGSNLYVYVNGVQAGSLSGVGPSYASYSGPNMLLGGIHGSAAIYLTANFDEARFSNIGRSADWILSEYNNQKPNSTFLTSGGLH